jgi:fatty-acyl-CoA synthase
LIAFARFAKDSLLPVRGESMGVWARAGREMRYLRGLNRTLKAVKDIDPVGDRLICDDIEAAVDAHADRVAVVFEDRQVTYRELDAYANRFANWAKNRGVRRGETVALVMPNRIEYLACWIGMTKAGVATALVNTNLTGAALAHSINIASANHVFADLDTWEAVEAVRHQLNRAMNLWVLGLKTEQETSDRRGLDAQIKGASAVRPDRTGRQNIQAKDTALYIYTSGTTGLPKAAKITHARAQLFMRAFKACTGATEKDRVYCALPLYHSTGGLCGLGAALLNGGAFVLRRKFSASHFWTDVVEKRCTMFVYIGELCRYLVNQPEHELERKHQLRLAFGNGLRPDVWKTFQTRFAVPQILEFYGATEGNVSLFNFDGRAGAIGRIPSYLRKRFNAKLIKIDLDTEEPVRDARGFCIEARPGEAGELIGAIGTEARNSYTGYADKAASEKKVLRDAFAKGDAWFRTGDLMRQDQDGYFYFVDRIGDTFRWKGENVSTTEVAERLAGAPGVKEITVYGVPVGDTEGKAGMVSLAVDPAVFTVEAFGRWADAELPAYARPVFVRVQSDLETTGTFKYRKVELVAEGFDRAKVADPLYFRDPESGYVELDKALHKKIAAGAVKL